ncbi:Lin1244/Lin1753 domain-containing protein [Alkalibacterium kapii]|uniref:DnaD domain-containing protein n=1 Tax=Alkalibacterium kapii TaxID=426704 RepID=A0A511B067_9LACT|nr:Lin1244/Lin1753 domain-containing protein [Alkalibacterium kapii]GEK91217.1 hypothetical protein AKA01nite_08390 [Alkalibacterium kapii]
MARPLQTGLTYFPLDVSIDQDDKIALIESDFGLEGFAVTIKLLMKIYAEGYMYHWGEKELKLFSRKIGVEVSLVSAIVDAGLRWGLFSQSLFDDYGILTSRGIQKRYFEAVSRRKNVSAVKEYFLLTEQDSEKYTNLSVVSLFPESLAETPLEEAPLDSAELMSTLTTQSIVKESREKDSKSSGEIEKEAPKTDDDDVTILDSYSRKIETPTHEVKRQLNDWLGVFKAPVILEAIERTQQNGKNYRYLHAILLDFKRKHVKTLADLVAYDVAFKRQKQRGTSGPVKQESLPLWTSSDHKASDEPANEATTQNIKDTLERIRSKKRE